MVNRIQPLMPVTAYKSFQIRSPLATHFRPASCAEAECEQRAKGWLIAANEGTAMGQRQAHLVRTSGRKYTEQRGYEPEGIPAAFTCFIFAPGQECFRPHKLPLDRPQQFIERDGDFRGNPTGFRRVHARPDDWIDAFATNQDKIADIVRRG